MKLERFAALVEQLVENELRSVEADSDLRGWTVAPFVERDREPHSFMVDNADGELQFLVAIVAP